MEEIDVLRAQAIASMSSSPVNPKSNNSDKTLPPETAPREEGELVSSEDDDLITSSAAQSASSTPRPAERDTVVKSLSTPNSAMGKCVSSVKVPASSVDRQVKPSVKKNFKPGCHYNPGWSKPPLPDTNLVIRFSDSESESDSEDNKPQKPLAKKDNITGVSAYKKPPTSPHTKPEVLQRTSSNQLKMMPKKVSLSRTFISSMTKINGANSKTPGSFSAAFQSRSSGPLNKTSSTQEGECSQSVRLNNSEADSLRQQIAIRENQLKVQLKSVQQRQEGDSGLYHEHSGTRLKDNAAVQRRPASVSFSEFSPNEQAKKRLKPDKPNCGRLISDGEQEMRRPATELTSKLPMVLRENNGIGCEDLVRNSKEIHVGRTDIVANRSTQALQPRNLQEVKDCEPSVSFNETIYPAVPTSKMPNKQGSCSIAGNTPNDSNSGNGTGLLDSTVPARRVSQFAQMTSGLHDGAASLRKMLSPEKSATKRSNHPRDSWDPHSSTSQSQQKNAPHEHLRMQSIEHNQVSHGDRVLKPSCDSIFDKGPVFVPAGEVADAYATPINTRPLNSLECGNLLVDDTMDVQTLAKMEEIQDKELEEAQEHRRMCEVEERKALKAYRKAQSALVEANTRCQNLFRRRDSISAQLQGCIIEESSSSWSSRCRNHMDTRCNLVDNFRGTELGQFPPLNYQKLKQLEGSNQLGSDNIQGKDDALLPSYQHNGALSLVSQPCMVPHADEDKDAATTDFRNFQSRLSCGNERSVGMAEMECRDNPEKKSSASDPQDYALLEASLRTELFSRLGSKTVSRSSDLHCGAEGSVSKGVECLAENKSQSGLVNQPLVEEEQNLMLDCGGTKGLGENIIHRTSGVTKQCLGDMFSDLQSRAFVAPDDCSMAPTEACRRTVAGPDIPSSALRTAFNHLKNTASMSSIGFQTRNKRKSVSEISGEAYDPCDTSGAHFIEDITKGTDMEGFGSYVCDPSVDPFWPLCMFELRGKCNNEKCPWQHVKDFGKNVKQLGDSERADCEVGMSSDLGEFNGRPKLSQLMSAPPIYIVSSDVLGAQRTSGSVLSRSIGQSCLNRFSTSLIVNSPSWKHLLADAPFLHVTDGRIEGQRSWDRQSLYLKTQDSAMKQHKKGLADPEQSLELAIVLFSEDVSRREGKKKALAVLSRALEADPTSVVLWMVYLHMYYRNEKVIGSGKDDMFLHAIQKNEDSYELWLMYINSRIHVEDRLVAYDTALGALCRFASSDDCDKMHISACILDLFLQMMEFLCMSEDIGKAVQRIYGFLPTETGISDWGSMSLSNILSFLSVSDKSIFWVCCVYLVMYRKLPDSVLQQFEFEKELQLPIEWPSPVHLTADDKCRVLKLMEVGIDSVGHDINSYSHERENNYKYAHLLAVYHAQCVEVLEDSECSKNLVKGYIELHPTCLDFVLTLARLNNKFAGDLGYEGFEKALHSWPKDVPGIQCIWNQYVQYALEKGEIKFAEVLMVRWFEDSWKVSSLQAEEPDGCISYPKSKDELFGLLNLALHKVLQKDQVEARCMIDKALKIASPEYFKHCVSEHAMFILSNILESIEDGASVSGGILGLLNGYLCDPRFSSVSEPLSRKFCQDIRKPRTRQLVNCMLGSVSRDCSLLNTILKAWYGPSLLPKEFGDLKDLVDHVEVLMEIFPANYRLALSACELIIQHHNFSNDVAFASAAFWASSLVVNALCQSNPLPPEKTWVEACGVLSNLGELHGISERFHQQAVSVYPFSVKLWKSYLDFSKVTGNMSVVIDAARRRGVNLE
ncbi:hypothetical protein MKW98_018161 [Papaver atlanticum]|uniref:C3H1-type domain-containing protein n=1 Tax=Papaver atlanticum TaxID=357466 RepID=A0AAD4XAY1_9MAGN|nr:hypothetical protein MKW98_018161 [Papaver atlanticum]